MTNKFNSPLVRSTSSIQTGKTLFKFGGSSLADAQGYHRATQLIQKQLEPGDLVVVSASGNTTDWLQKISHNDEQKELYINSFYEHHRALILQCASKLSQTKLLNELNKNCQWLTQLTKLESIASVSNDILALGEIWSAKLLCYLLEAQYTPSSWLDARQCIKLLWRDGDYELDESNSKKRLDDQLIARENRITIVTGYIASDCESNTITLGRNGSDYSATIIAKLVNAKSITLWTDVAGIYDFDPKFESTATALRTVNIKTIEELGFLGSPVLHVKTLQPLSEVNTTLNIRSIFSPNSTGTDISQDLRSEQYPIFSHKNNLVRFSIQCFKQSEKNNLIKYLQKRANQVNSDFTLLMQNSATSFDWLVTQDLQDFWGSYLESLKADFILESVKQCSLLAIIYNRGPKNIKQQFKDFISVHFKQSKFIERKCSITSVVDLSNINDVALACYKALHNRREKSKYVKLSPSNSTVKEKSLEPHHLIKATTPFLETGTILEVGTISSGKKYA